MNIAVGATMPSINTQILKDIPISYPSFPEQKVIASVLSSLDDKIDLLHRQNKTLETMAETLFRQWFIEEAKEDWEEMALGNLITVKESDKLAEELKLTEYEYAFYSAVAENESAKELMQKEILRELAVVLTASIRKSVTLDWTIKESARAKLRVIVKRLLKKYGYPPDMALLATETVLEQAEQLAEELAQLEGNALESTV
ncbi:type I restriction enzyme endonuclease domain-containing protein [Acinetobacter baumannii]